MKKLLTMLLTLSLACTALTACKDSNESSKTAELEKRVAELESQVSEQSTTTTTTTANTTNTTTTTKKSTTTSMTTTTATTTPETTTTTAQTFDTTWYSFNAPEQLIATRSGELYAAPDKNSKVLYTFEEGATFDVHGYANMDWLAVYIDDTIVFAENFKLAVITTTTTTMT